MLRITDANRPWWTLLGACTGLFVLMLDSTIVALALPSIQHDIGASASGVQWVMNGYLLVIAALVVTGGRIGDIFGRRAVFTVGLAIFAAGSVLSGAAGARSRSSSAGWCRGSAPRRCCRSRSRSFVTHSRPLSSLALWGSGPRSRR